MQNNTEQHKPSHIRRGLSVIKDYEMSLDTGKRLALVLDPADNVATLLFDAAKEENILLKGAPGTVRSKEIIKLGHKIALRSIIAGEKIVKYGQQIGYAVADITEGEWVHLHNMASILDADFRKRIED
jgi:hypothetical protein